MRRSVALLGGREQPVAEALHSPVVSLRPPAGTVECSSVDLLASFTGGSPAFHDGAHPRGLLPHIVRKSAGPAFEATPLDLSFTFRSLPGVLEQSRPSLASRCRSPVEGCRAAGLARFAPGLRAIDR